MATYAFANPISNGKTAQWKAHVEDMTGPRAAQMAESRRKAGLRTEHVWLQSTPAGDLAIVYWEADDIAKVFEHFMTSQDAFDQWFREKVLVDVHGMDPSVPPPPMNEPIL